MSHTKGPWKAIHLEGGKRGCGEQIMIAGPERGQIIFAGLPCGAEEQIANARLMAASPELLGACKAALILVQQMKAETCSDADRAALLRTLNAVIAKAEGKR